MKKKEIKGVISFSLVVILLFGLASIGGVGCKGKAEVETPEITTLTLGTGLDANDILNALHRATVRAVSKQSPELEITSIANPRGTAEAIRNIESYKLCGISVDEAAQAYYGFYRWQQPHPALRLLWVMGNIRLALVVANDTDIKSVSELEGKPFGCGEPGSMAELKTRKLFEALGITPEWSEASWSTQIELYQQGRLVGLVAQSNPADSRLLECAEQRPFTILPLSETELNKATQFYTGTGLTYSPCPILPDTYPGQEEMLTTYGLMVGYFTHKDIAAELIYKLTEDVWGEVWAISVAYEPLKLDILGFPKLTLEQGPFPLHPGMVKFYKALVLTVPDHLVPPELK